MSRLAAEGFAERMVHAVNDTPSFGEEARWFDGSILLDDDGGQVWLKLYNGRVIDHLPFTPPTGYTFKVVGAQDAWDELVAGAHFTDLVLAGTRRFNGMETVVDGVGSAPGRITFEGNTMEAFRLIEAIYLIAGAYASTARTEEEAA